MKIANIFGLYLGCNVRFPFNNIYEIDVLRAVRSNVEYGHILEFDFFPPQPINGCKLVLKPISSIKEEDKFKINNINNARMLSASVVMNKVWIEYFNAGRYFKYSATPKQVVLLAQLGYDIGIVPDEYKIMIGDC